jgi:hypothetical protein
MVLSKSAFARLANVSQPAVSMAVGEGRLVAEAGKLDPGHPVNATFIAAHRNDNGANGTEAQVSALIVKARWQADRLKRAVDAHVEKAAIAGGIRQTLQHLCEAAPLLPDRYGRVVAARLGITEDVARALLQDVTGLLLAETAALPEQGYAAALRLS